ncbi:MAG: prepilin-type N-terminal cleavage/methylation domain-containing protein, partial [Candidatus Omnitrophica bacterium]|nr:prepilin-type N-terminal cleavage/methylation domain-containing protein [Candidatus Omnitrophota bacterium]
MSRGLNRRRTRAMTLMELMVALVLLGMIVLGIMNLEIFCKHAFTTTDRKTKVMNEATYVIE